MISYPGRFWIRLGCSPAIVRSVFPIWTRMPSTVSSSVDVGACGGGDGSRRDSELFLRRERWFRLAICVLFRRPPAEFRFVRHHRSPVVKCTGFADRKSGRKALIERMRRDEEQHRGRREIADRAVRDPRGGSRRLDHSLVLSALHLTIICVLVDAPFRSVFCRGRRGCPSSC